MASAVVAPLRPLRAGQVVVAGGGRDLLWSPHSIAVHPMAVLTPVPAAPVEAHAPGTNPSASGPACSLQRVAPQGAPGKSASLWQLGIEAQELTTAVGQLAELEAALLAEESNKAALAAKADATCWVIEHLRAQAA